MPLSNLYHQLRAHFGLFIYGMGQVFSFLVPLLAVPHIVEICGETAFGKVGVALAICFVLIVIIDYGADFLGVKEVSINRNNPEQLSRIFITAFTSRFILLLIVLLIASLVISVVPYFRAESRLFLFSAPILIGQFISPIWFLQGVEKFRLITILTISSKVIYLLGVLIFVRSADDYILVNFFWGCGMFLPFLLGFLYCRKLFHIKSVKVSWSEIFFFLSSNFRFCISQIFLSFKNYAPILVINFLGGYSAAGWFKIIEQIVMPFRTYLQMFYRYFYPKLCFVMNNSKAEGHQYWKRVSVLNLGIVVVPLLLLMAFPLQILAYFNVDAQTALFLENPLRLSGLIPLVITISYSLEQLMLSLGQKNNYIKYTIITVIANLILMISLYWWLDFYGIILAVIGSEVVLIVLIWFGRTKNHQIQPRNAQ